MVIEIDELAARLQEALSRVEAGEEVVIARGASPVARITPCVRKERVLGLHPGAIQLADDFDAPLPDEFWLGGTP